MKNLNADKIQIENLLQDIANAQREIMGSPEIDRAMDADDLIGQLAGMSLRLTEMPSQAMAKKIDLKLEYIKAHM